MNGPAYETIPAATIQSPGSNSSCSVSLMTLSSNGSGSHPICRQIYIWKLTHGLLPQLPNILCPTGLSPLSSLDFACTKKSDSKFGMASCAVSYSQSCSAFSPPRPPINLCLDSSNPAQRLKGIFHVKNHMEIPQSLYQVVLFCIAENVSFHLLAEPRPFQFDFTHGHVVLQRLLLSLREIGARWGKEATASK